MSSSSSSRAAASRAAKTSGSVGPYFWVEAKQHVAALLQTSEPVRIGVDAAPVLAGRAGQLVGIGEGAVEQRLPGSGRRIEALQRREQLRRPGEPRRVERLVELARQPPQLVGVRQPLRFTRERVVLAHLGVRGADFFHHVLQVVGFAAHVFLLAPQLLLTLLEPFPLLMRVAGGAALDLGVAERIEQLALHVGAQQGLGFVLAVQVHQQRTELAQDADCRGTAVHPGAGAALGGDFALENQLAVLGVHAQGGQGRAKAVEGGRSTIQRRLRSPSWRLQAGRHPTMPARRAAARARPPAWTCPHRSRR